MTLCQAIPLSFIVVVFGVTFVIVKPGEMPKDNLQWWTRSLVVGVSTTVIVILGFLILGLNQASNGCLSSINDLIGPWIACFGLPAFLVATFGYYFGYKQLFWLHSIREKIKRNKKN